MAHRLHVRVALRNCAKIEFRQLASEYENPPTLIVWRLLGFSSKFLLLLVVCVGLSERICCRTTSATAHDEMNRRGARATMLAPAHTLLNHTRRDIDEPYLI